MHTFPRCQIVPLPDSQVGFMVDGQERLRWHSGSQYPRPFFYPFIGPTGSTLTRVGHPGAPNHDHHRSIWFGHHKVAGMDFWGDAAGTQVRQKQWLVYEDGDEEAVMAVRLAWYDGHDPQELLEQEVIAAVRPGDDQEVSLELQTTLRPQAATLELGQTNFGLLAVRVAKNISTHFGGGTLVDSEGRTGESGIFGQRARWVDYAGPVPGADATSLSTAGILYADHPMNVTYPSHWHVREDGWMGASLCMQTPVQLIKDDPLTLRYLLHAHRGPVDQGRFNALAEAFAGRRPFRLQRSSRKHRQFDVARA